MALRDKFEVLCRVDGSEPELLTLEDAVQLDDPEGKVEIVMTPLLLYTILAAVDGEPVTRATMAKIAGISEAPP